MTELLYGRDREVAEWVAEKIDDMDAFGACAAIGVAVKGRLIAGVVYDQYQPRYDTMQVSMAATSPIWARRETIAKLLAYPFLQLDVFKLWTQTAHANAKALRVNQHIGFRFEAMLSHQFGLGRHSVISRLLKPEYLFLYGDRDHGQKLPVAAASA